MSQKHKVFLIDDDRMTLKFLQHIFSSYHVELSTFQNPNEGLDAISTVRPDLVFIDYMMPEMNGDDLIVKVSEGKLFKDCALYLLSANDFSDLEVIKFRTLGFYNVLKKPLTREDLEEVFHFHFGEVPKAA